MNTRGKRIEASTRKPEWRCVESKTVGDGKKARNGKMLQYSRFVLFPLLRGQGETIGFALRRALLGEVEGTYITRARFVNVNPENSRPHEFSMLFGMQEPMQEILHNLQEICLRGNLHGTHDAFILVRGPKLVTAKDIILPPFVEVIDAEHFIATVVKPIDLHIELKIERCRGGYRDREADSTYYEDGSFSIYGFFSPVQGMNHGVYSFQGENKEILFLEIWTDGSLTPREVFREASRKLIDFFSLALNEEGTKQKKDTEDPKEEETEESEEKEGLGFDRLKDAQNPSHPCQHLAPLISLLRELGGREGALKCVTLDQFPFTRGTYLCLQRYEIFTLWDFLKLTDKDFARIRIPLSARKYALVWEFLEMYSLFVDEP